MPQKCLVRAAKTVGKSPLFSDGDVTQRQSEISPNSPFIDRVGKSQDVTSFNSLYFVFVADICVFSLAASLHEVAGMAVMASTASIVMASTARIIHILFANTDWRENGIFNGA